MSPDGLSIRDLKTEDEFRELVHVQESIWGFSPIDLLPVRFFVVASKIGGQVFGAYDNGCMVAFCLAIPGLKPGNKPYLHSHMLGVLPEYRDSGLGRRLKMHQRVRRPPEHVQCTPEIRSRIGIIGAQPRLRLVMRDCLRGTPQMDQRVTDLIICIRHAGQ